MKILDAVWFIQGKFHYNYFLELCSLIFLVAITVAYFSRKKFPVAIFKLFGVCLIVLSVFGYLFFFLSSNTTKNTEYLRIHVRANSNLTQDQDVKYEVKNSIVDALYPIVAKCTSKTQLMAEIDENKGGLEEVANKTLHNLNLSYNAKITLNSQFFPTRVYNNNITLFGGVYDALIVELGEAEGDNWWCIVYPPLCFMNVNYSKNTGNFIAQLYIKSEEFDRNKDTSISDFWRISEVVLQIFSIFLA